MQATLILPKTGGLKNFVINVNWNIIKFKKPLFFMTFLKKWFWEEMFLDDDLPVRYCYQLSDLANPHHKHQVLKKLWPKGSCSFQQIHCFYFCFRKTKK